MIRLLFLVASLVLVAGEDDGIKVPPDVMKFILGCKRQGILDSDLVVPVYETSIDDAAGTTSKHLSLLDMDELGHSLRQTVSDEDVLNLILGQVREALEANMQKERQDACSVENNIQIAIPPQEVDEFNDRIQMITQQNNRLLLEQINNLFTYKLRSHRVEMEKFFKRKSSAVVKKLDRILALLGEDEEEEKEAGGDVTGDDMDDAADAVTELPGTAGETHPIVFPESESTDPEVEPEPTPVTEPETEPESHSAEEPSTTTPEPSAEPESEPSTPTVPTPDNLPVTESPMPSVDAPSITTLFPTSSNSDSKSSEEEVVKDTSDTSSSDEYASKRTSEEVSSDGPKGFVRVAQIPVSSQPSLEIMRPIIQRERLPILSHRPQVLTPVYHRERFWQNYYNRRSS